MQLMIVIFIIISSHLFSNKSFYEALLANSKRPFYNKFKKHYCYGGFFLLLLLLLWLQYSTAELNHVFASKIKG